MKPWTKHKYMNHANILDYKNCSFYPPHKYKECTYYVPTAAGQLLSERGHIGVCDLEEKVTEIEEILG